MVWRVIFMTLIILRHKRVFYEGFVRGANFNSHVEAPYHWASSIEVAVAMCLTKGVGLVEADRAPWTWAVV